MINPHYFKIVKEPPGVLHETETWVCCSDGYLYTASTLQGLISLMEREWKHEKHLVG